MCIRDSLKEVRKVVAKIKAVEPKIQELSDDGLRGKTAEFKEKIQNAAAGITAQIEQVQEQIKNCLLYTSRCV